MFIVLYIAVPLMRGDGTERNWFFARQGGGLPALTLAQESGRQRHQVESVREGVFILIFLKKVETHDMINSCKSVIKLEDDAQMGKGFAPGEARTHGLQIMRLTRCLLRYRGLM